MKIYIILFREPTIALNLNSAHTKNSLTKLHPNIILIRHPKHVLPFLWSHHEKMVVIDQKIGFLGGLDICFGRMDNQRHLLYDQPHYDQETREILFTFPGIDYSNIRVKDFYNVEKHDTSYLDRNT